MTLSLPKQIVIGNEKLRLTYYLLIAAVVLFEMGQLIQSRKFLKKVPHLNAQLLVQIPSDENFAAYDSRDHRLCDPWSSNETDKASRNFVAQRCVDQCRKGYRLIEPCTIDADVAYIESSSSIFMPLSELEKKYEVSDVHDPDLFLSKMLMYNLYASREHANFSFPYRIEVPESEIPSFFGFNGAGRVPRLIRSKDTHSVFIDARGAPVSGLIFPPGTEAKVLAPMLLHLAMQRRKDFTIPKEKQWSDSKLNANDGSMTQFPGWAFLVGASIAIDIGCYTNAYDLKKATSYDYDWGEFNPSYKKPVCLHSLYFEAQVGQRIHQTSSEVGKTIQRETFGIQMRAETNTVSYTSVFDTDFLLVFVLSFLVFLRLPLQITSFIMLNCLGHLSTIYLAVVQQPFRVRQQCVRTVMQLLASGASFTEMTNETHGELSKKDTLNRLTSILENKADLDADELNVLVDFVHTEIVGIKKPAKRLSLAFPSASAQLPQQVEKSKSSDPMIINQEQFCAQVSNENLGLDTIVKLFDKDRKWQFLEKLFLPPDLAKAIHRTQEHIKDSVEESSPEESSLPVSSLETKLNIRDDTQTIDELLRNSSSQEAQKIDLLLQKYTDLENTVRTLQAQVSMLASVQEDVPKPRSDECFGPLPSSKLHEHQIKVEVKGLEGRSAITSGLASSRACVDTAHSYEDQANLNARISWLEALVGSIHETAPEEIEALSFDVCFPEGLCNFSEFQQARFCQTVARNLVCDLVEIQSLHNDRNVASILAVGFASAQFTNSACAFLQMGRVAYVCEVEPHHITSPIKQVTCWHRPTHWLRLARQEHAQALLNAQLNLRGSS